MPRTINESADATQELLHRRSPGSVPPRRLNLTDEVVSGLPLPATGRMWVRDEAPGGLAVMLTQASRSWYYVGQRQRIGLGRWPGMSAHAARLAALAIAAKVATGGNVLRERRDQRRARAEAKTTATEQTPTIKEAWEQWQIERAPQLRPATVRTYDLRWRLGLAEFSMTKIDAFTTSMASNAFNRAAREHGQVTANRLRTLGRLLHRWACRRYDHESPDPWRHVRAFEEAPRTRTPTVAELQRLMEAAGAAPPTPRDAIRLLLWTGQRIGVIKTACWCDFDLDAGVWHLPAYRAKGRRYASIPLVPNAVAMLRQRRLLNEHPQWVFPGGSHAGHFGCIRQTWATTCKRAGVSNLTRHDVRRGLAVALTAAGVALPVVSRLLAHSTISVTASHYVALRAADLRPAISAFSHLITPPATPPAQLPAEPAEEIACPS